MVEFGGHHGDRDDPPAALEPGRRSADVESALLVEPAELTRGLADPSFAEFGEPHRLRTCGTHRLPGRGELFCTSNGDGTLGRSCGEPREPGCLPGTGALCGSRSSSSTLGGVDRRTLEHVRGHLTPLRKAPHQLPGVLVKGNSRVGARPSFHSFMWF